MQIACSAVAHAHAKKTPVHGSSAMFETKSSYCRVARQSFRATRQLACDHALSLYLCNLFSGGGHDTFLSQVTCKKARIWTFF